MKTFISILLFSSVLLLGQSTIKTSALTTVVDLGGQIRATTPYGQLIVVSGNQLIVLNSNLKKVLTIPIQKEGYGEDTWCISKFQNIIAVKTRSNTSRQINYDVWDLKSLKKINNISFLSDCDIDLSDFQLSEFGSYFVSMIWQNYSSGRLINGRKAYGNFYCQIWYVGNQFHSKQINSFNFPDYNENNQNVIRFKYCDSIGFRISDKYSLPRFNTYPIQKDFQSIYSDRDLFVSSFNTDEEGMIPTIDGKNLYIKSTPKKYYKVNLAKFQNKEKALTKYPALFGYPPSKDEFMTTSEYRKLVAKYESDQKNGLSLLASLPVSDETEKAAMAEIDSVVTNGIRKEEAVFLNYKDMQEPEEIKETEVEKEYSIFEIGVYNADKQTLNVSILFDDNLRSTEIKLPRNVARRIKSKDSADTFKVIAKYSKKKLHHFRLYDLKENKSYDFPKTFEVSDDEDYERFKG